MCGITGLIVWSRPALRLADDVVFAVAHDEYVTDGSSPIVNLLKGVLGIVRDVKSKRDCTRKLQGVDP
jgi:hypothetical protein